MKDPSKLSSKPLRPFFVETCFRSFRKRWVFVIYSPWSWRRKSKEIKILNKVLSKKLLYIYTNNNFTDFGISAPFINYYLLQNKPYDDEYLTKYETVFNDKMYKGKYI